jgi:hypothetical protein
MVENRKDRRVDVMHIAKAVMEVVQQWAGFDPLHAALRRCPELRVYLAGGVVRRTLLGECRPVKDYDLFFEGIESQELAAELGRTGRIEFGPYGAPRWQPAEAGAPYADLIPIRRFTNGLAPCETFVDVLNQLDFTLNAVGLDVRTGEVFDPQQGIRDARRRVLRAVRFDRPDVPIGCGIEVTHRTAFWHRLVHYAHVLQLRIEPATLRWLHTRRPTVEQSRAFAEAFFVPALGLFEDPESIRVAVASPQMVAV